MDVPTPHDSGSRQHPSRLHWMPELAGCEAAALPDSTPISQIVVVIFQPKTNACSIGSIPSTKWLVISQPKNK
jgi:hypothetical protein